MFFGNLIGLDPSIHSQKKPEGLTWRQSAPTKTVKWIKIIVILIDPEPTTSPC